MDRAWSLVKFVRFGRNGEWEADVGQVKEREGKLSEGVLVIILSYYHSLSCLPSFRMKLPFSSPADDVPRNAVSPWKLPFSSMFRFLTLRLLPPLHHFIFGVQRPITTSNE